MLGWRQKVSMLGGSALALRVLGLATFVSQPAPVPLFDPRYDRGCPYRAALFLRLPAWTLYLARK